MWIFLNDAFISVVKSRNSRLLLARARFRGDLERALHVNSAYVMRTPDADYPYRVAVTREHVADALREAVDKIDYGNFKASIPKRDKRRSRAYLSVWAAMERAGDNADNVKRWTRAK